MKILLLSLYSLIVVSRFPLQEHFDNKHCLALWKMRLSHQQFSNDTDAIYFDLTSQDDHGTPTSKRILSKKIFESSFLTVALIVRFLCLKFKCTSKYRCFPVELKNWKSTQTRLSGRRSPEKAETYVNFIQTMNKARQGLSRVPHRRTHAPIM